MIGEFIDETLSGDRVVFSFITVWVIAGAIWIMLDWLGNTSRGRFVPKGDQHHGTVRTRLSEACAGHGVDTAGNHQVPHQSPGGAQLEAVHLGCAPCEFPQRLLPQARQRHRHTLRQVGRLT